MASLQLPTCTSHFYANSTAAEKSSATRFLLNRPNRKHINFRKTLSCRAAKEQEDENKARSESKLDRRDVLVGLGGLYGSAAVRQDAFAAPVDATNCSTAGTLPSCTNVKDQKCCPPPNPNISDYVLPEYRSLRTRPAAHLANRKYVEKYNKALKIMRSLPNEHPHSFAQQAAIHCAYCDSAYEMVGFPNAKIDVHFSWLFFPFHRWYLYFYERILGKLIGDPDFAIPYWNWDAKAGVSVPDMFNNRDSPLYDKLRNDDSQLKMDLNYDYKDAANYVSPVGKQLIESNKSLMYTSMVSARTPTLFFGQVYRGGDAQINGPGTIERQPHTAVHVLMGDRNQINGEDMGRFYSAGRDPIFYSHHANVDRLWNIWKRLPGKNRKDFDQTDYLDSAFLFYDENEKLVRVKIRDCLDSSKLGYDYEKVPLEWLNSRAPRKAPRKKAGVANAAEVFPKADEVFPKVLDGLIKVTVPRPKKSRSKEEKEDAEEILVIDGIEYDGNEYVKFDVYINDEDEIESGPNNAEFAGTFSNVPSVSKLRTKASLTFGINELLEDLDADGDETLVVALVPRTGKGKVTIGGARIIISSE
ncbi:hypothetical protein DCAR_0522456 [Daucus carota subsp. sativus]|uniref:Uncharacterized protein n=1 Tax=Daucus carota subsp. sativus TaxID=79200 RepID=A0A164ZTV5_DAUCS|nr:PREDICTED: polyphenol oxidase I, chloroplastic-like [Daucus carota subsp. sativus]WOH03065.1 hypothetical protein DCAR_0522456 [Daucus carota subsp. sativus]